MRATIQRCDICGAEHSAENPVTVRVSDCPTGAPVKIEHAFGFLMDAQPAADLDLCRACALPIYQILSERRKAAVGDRRVAFSVDLGLSDVFKTQMGRAFLYGEPSIVPPTIKPKDGDA